MMKQDIVKVSSYKIFALKLGIFSLTLAYLAGDLFLWHGAVWKTLHVQDAESEATPPPAVVYGKPITAEQLDRYVAEQNWLRGREKQATPAERTVMLMELVRENILLLRTRYNDKNLPDYAAAAQEEVSRLATRARSDEDFDARLHSQGYTRQSFTRRLEMAMKAAALLERAVLPHCDVTDEDVAKHYELLREELIAPAQRPLRHIFLSTIGQDEDAVKRRAQNILQQLEEGAEFTELARKYSEDDRTAAKGGELGAVRDDERFPLRELPLFGEDALPADKPALAQSRWGWHILLPGEITPARQLTLEETKESLRTAIQSAQRELSAKAWGDKAVQEAFTKKHLQIHAN